MSRKNKNYDAYSLADLFREMELELIASASRTLAKHEAWEKEERFKWEQWQLAKLRSLQQYQVNNRKIIKSYKNEMRSIINDVIKSTYSESYQESLKIAQEVEDVL